jgi:hypothetical protein
MSRMDQPEPEPHSDPADVAARWSAAWASGATSDLFRLMAAGVVVESNLDPDGDFIEILTGFAARLDGVSVASQTAVDGRVAIVYDCTTGDETFRLAEFLEVEDGLVRVVRRVYDLDAVSRLMPGLVSDP